MREFKFVNKRSYLVYLKFILTSTIRYHKTLKSYYLEVCDICKDKGINEQLFSSIESNLYYDINNKSQHVIAILLNLLADYSKEAVSYKKFRKTIKSEAELYKLIGETPEKVANILNGMHIQRNWGHHIAESFITVEEDYINYVREQGMTIDDNFENIFLDCPINVDGKYMLKLKESMELGFQEMDLVIEQMKADYERLVGNKVQYFNCIVMHKEYDDLFVQASLNVQNKIGKY